MRDTEIVQLYWDRDERAIPATGEKYGRYCVAIARNILGSREDAEECVNDTYWSAWNAMPPHRPDRLSVFLGKLTRNLAFNRYKQNTAEKRGGGEVPAVLDELAELIPGGETPEETLDRGELLGAINGFLETLPAKSRAIFLRRYWYTDSVSGIAERYGMRANAVSMTLSRLRAKLREHLLERGFSL